MAIPNKPAVRTINDNNKIWSYSLGLWGPGKDGDECRYHTCEHAWKFMSQFRRNDSGKIEIINSGKSNGIF